MNLGIVYAFAACEHGIVHNDEGCLIDVMQFVHYQLNTMAKDLPISEKLIHWLEVLFYRLGVDSVSVRFEWFESLGVDLRDRIVNEALSRIKGCPKCQISISACASFDTQIDDWVFVNYPIIEERVSMH